MTSSFIGNHPLITVLLVTRNRREFVDRCLSCLCRTSQLDNILIYVWDNASEDDTSDYLATYKEHPFIIPIRSNKKSLLVTEEKFFFPR